MKPLNELSNEDKAAILFDLFPKHRFEIVQVIKEVAEIIQKDKDEIISTWKAGAFMSAEYWIALSENCAGLIQQHGHSITKNKSPFLELFEGHNAVFANHCVQAYMKRDMDISDFARFRNFCCAMYDMDYLQLIDQSKTEQDATNS